MFTNIMFVPLISAGIIITLAARQVMPRQHEKMPWVQKKWARKLYANS